MLKRTVNPSIKYDAADEEVIAKKAIELNIEVISRYPKENNRVSLHIYGTEESVEELLTWMDENLTGEMEAEF